MSQLINLPKTALGSSHLNTKSRKTIDECMNEFPKPNNTRPQETMKGQENPPISHGTDIIDIEAECRICRQLQHSFPETKSEDKTLMYSNDNLSPGRPVKVY